MKSIVKRDFADRLQAAREEKDWTQEKLAEFLGVGVGAVSKWEQARRLPGEALFREICRVLEKPPGYFTGTGKESPTIPGLTAVIQEQERRIQALESQLAAQRVHPQPGAQDRSTPPSDQNFAESGGEFQDILEKISKDPNEARRVRLLLGLSERPKQLAQVKKDPLKKNPDPAKS